MISPLKVYVDAHHKIHAAVAHVQDSIVSVSSFIHTQENQTFKFLAHRFCWDHYHKAKESFRVHAGVHFDHVESVHKKNIHLHHPDKFLNLLTLIAREDGKEIRLVFSEHAEILLKLNNFSLKIKDVGEPYPTSSVPEHELSLKF